MKKIKFNLNTNPDYTWTPRVQVRQFALQWEKIDIYSYPKIKGSPLKIPKGALAKIKH